ncbi:MAG: ZIP family metal transporter [Lachnospiraceae bacterium]|nr:ZIP family metal transporter [Lachnospiraceae bacterium]
MNGILLSLWGTLFTFSVTALGAGNVFWMKKHVAGDVQCVFLGFAGGVMIAASVWSLLIPALERAETAGQMSWLVVSVGFIFGVLLLLAADRLVKKHLQRVNRNKISLRTRTELLVLAITIHNIPEGMAVGLAFALAAGNPEKGNLLSGAVALAIGIGIQNYPEGTAVALPLIADGMSKRKAFLLGSMSAIVEPVFGVLAAGISGIISPMMPLLLSLAAGTMIYVVVEELIPEAHMGKRDTVGTFGFVLGFLIMMILDVALKA